MITAQDLQALAGLLVARHGPTADSLAARAIAELEAQGELWRADHWRALRSVMADMIEGRLDPEARTLTLQ